jgi:glutaredoxin
MAMPIARAFAVTAAVAVLLGWNSALLAGEVIEKSIGSPDSRVVLFSQPFCPGCEAAKYYFHDNQISYLEFDITASRAARDTFERLGGRGTPFFLIGGERLHGFSVPRIEQRLKELGISGRSHE